MAFYNLSRQARIDVVATISNEILAELKTGRSKKTISILMMKIPGKPKTGTKSR